ncbi:MAG: exo-alpha-sialidase [Candidatus Hydrogenedentes bacterium]|nr:exo-alpha-sialidase [Candidatus Hydrogenedentota bacterium]
MLPAVFTLFMLAAAQAGPNPLDTDADWEFVGGRWSIADGRAVQADPGAIAYAFHGNTALQDPAVETRFRVDPAGAGVQAAGLILASVDSQHAYFVHYDTRNDQVILFRGDLRREGSEVARQTGIPMDTGRWYTARAEVRDGTVTVSLDGRVVLTAQDASYAAGLIGLYTSQGAVEFTNLSVAGRPALLDPPWQRARLAYEPPKEQPMATILETRVLCKQPGRYIGWPSIAQAPNGDVLAVFSGDRAAHISPEGKVQMVRSRDRGASWAEPVTVYDTPIDDRDAGIIRTQSGAMLVSWFTNPGGGDWQGHWTIRSTDNGHTWGDPVRTEVTTPHGPTQLRDGRLLFVGQRPHESHGPNYDVGIQESRDDGQSWQAIGTFPVPEGERMLAFDECHVVECASGRLLIGFRDCYEPHRMRVSESTDGGHTWSPPRVTPVHGYPPHLIRLDNDWLLAVYGKRWEPYGEYACISKDDGQTWDVDHEITLCGAFDGDLGYPASCQLDDGSIWTVFYQSEQPGEKPCLMGTHWRCRTEP